MFNLPTLKLAPICLTLYLVNANSKSMPGYFTPKVSRFHISSRLKKECKQVLLKKRVCRICGVTAYVIAFAHKIFRQASKSNNVGCDPTNPTYPFLFGE